VRANDLAALKLGEGNEIDDCTAVNVGSLDAYRPARVLLPGHFEDVLRARRTNGYHHRSLGCELPQQIGRDVVDAAGDDDLVEGRRIGPAVVPIGILAVDRLVFRVAVIDQAGIDAASALEQGLDDLDRVDLVG